MADVMEHNKSNTGQKINTDPVAPAGKPAPPWLGSIWIGPIRAERDDDCLICTVPIEAGDIIVFRHTKRETVAMCMMCAESIEELDIRPPGR